MVNNTVSKNNIHVVVKCLFLKAAHFIEDGEMYTHKRFYDFEMR